MIDIPSSCTGCSACINICPKNCITMENNVGGFLYPVVNSVECINCNQCKAVCPILQPPKPYDNVITLALKNKCIFEREGSSSGGIFPILAKYVLDKKGIVFGAAYDSNYSVHHIAITKKADISLLQGAKYSQSILDYCFSEIKKNLCSGRVVLFSGTPCQCMGLQAFLGKQYDNLIMVDLICHGVPAPEIWQKYIDYRSNKENYGIRPIKINMRSKSSGWSNYGYSTEFMYDNGKITQICSGQDLFMKAFIGNICLRNSCSECYAKGVNRCTDFTLGDYWGIWDQYPEFDDDKGISIIFIHSKKGKNILSQLKDKFECIEVDINDAYRENMSLVVSSKVHEKRNEFLERTTSDNFEEMVSIYFLPIKANPEGNIQKIKNIVKTFLKKYIRNLEN